MQKDTRSKVFSVLYNFIVLNHYSLELLRANTFVQVNLWPVSQYFEIGLFYIIPSYIS